jgi:hypothetical protein
MVTLQGTFIRIIVMKPALALALLVVMNTCTQADTILFSDLGPGGSYLQNTYYQVLGSNFFKNSSSQAWADSFTVAGSGTDTVSKIDIGAGPTQGGPTSTFYASIWTDESGAPGTQVAGAYWTFSNTTAPGALVSITGISGVSLTGGADYFMVLGPLNLSSNALLGWYGNNQSYFGDLQNSSNGGATWHDLGSPGLPFASGAFDVLGSSIAGVPEPSPLAILIAGFAVLGLCKRRVDANLLKPR